MTESHRHTAKYTDTGTPIAINLDLSRIATDEQVITREDWAAIPGLMGWEVDQVLWDASAPDHGEEFVKRNGKWCYIDTSKRVHQNALSGPEILICDLAIPLLAARDSRVPEVGQ